MAKELDFSVLPKELRHLAPLISWYSESDDDGRSELLEHASDEELRQLSEAPETHWKKINAFLDQNVESDPGPTQDVALALDSFAQAAMEAKFELDARADR
ncbi:MAG TPA: hypothetical protein VF025_11450 [Gaiellaceae bacterium]